MTKCSISPSLLLCLQGSRLDEQRCSLPAPLKVSLSPCCLVFCWEYQTISCTPLWSWLSHSLWKDKASSMVVCNIFTSSPERPSLKVGVWGRGTSEAPTSWPWYRWNSSLPRCDAGKTYCHQNATETPKLCGPYLMDLWAGSNSGTIGCPPQSSIWSSRTCACLYLLQAAGDVA